MADRPEAMVDDLDLLLCAGTMSGETRDAILTAVRDTPTTLNKWQFERARTAIYLVLASPDYLVQK